MEGRDKRWWRKKPAEAGSKTENAEEKPRARRQKRDPTIPLTRQEAMDAALRLLSIRNRSRHELDLALKRRNTEKDLRDEVLKRLAELGYINDEKFAEERAKSLFRRGKFGSRGVLQKLRTHGLSDSASKEAVKAAAEELEVKPLDDARRLLERRGLAGRELSLKEKARAARLLRARGFDPDVARQLISTSGLESDELDS